MARPKKPRGRPRRPYPPRIDATPEQLLRAMFNTPHDIEIVEREYKCSVCRRPVSYPDILYAGDRCESCHTGAA